MSSKAPRHAPGHHGVDGFLCDLMSHSANQAES
jgi:hypothetical protein